MPRPYVPAVFAAAFIIWSGAAFAETLVIPTPDEAKGAVIKMFGDPDLAKSLKDGHVVIGTCKKTSAAKHADEVSCTIAVVMGAGSSETQANFYREGGQWSATPSEEDLSFPDPKLR